MAEAVRGLCRRRKEDDMVKPALRRRPMSEATQSRGRDDGCSGCEPQTTVKHRVPKMLHAPRDVEQLTILATAETTNPNKQIPK